MTVSLCVMGTLYTTILNAGVRFDVLVVLRRVCETQPVTLAT